MFYSPVTYDGEIVGVLIGVYQADNKMAKLLINNHILRSRPICTCVLRKEG